MDHLLGFSGLPVLWAGQHAWHRPHSVQEKKSSRSFQVNWKTLETPKVFPFLKTMRGTVLTKSKLRKKQLGMAVRMCRCLPWGRYVEKEEQGQGVDPPENPGKQVDLFGRVSGGQSDRGGATAASRRPSTVPPQMDLAGMQPEVGDHEGGDQGQDEVGVKRGIDVGGPESDPPHHAAITTQARTTSDMHVGHEQQHAG